MANYDLISSTSSIIDLIAEINTENENIQAGKSSINEKMQNLVSTLFLSIEDAKTDFLNKFLSDAQRIEYDLGTLTIDTIVSIELLSFYNALQKLKLYAESIQGIINSTVKQDDIRYYSDSNDYSLDSDQFEDDNENIVESVTNFYYYTVVAGDSFRLIAAKTLNDNDKFINILRINNISENDFIDDNIVGQQIKIPIDLNTITRGDDNLVFESDYTDMQKFLYGKDIATGLNKELLLSSTGDLREKVGIENVYAQIENRIKNRKGGLNVFNPNWGSLAIDDSNAPLMVKIDRYLTDLINQMQDDPRVESVQIDLNKLRYEGEVIKSSFSVFFIENEDPLEVQI